MEIFFIEVAFGFLIVVSIIQFVELFKKSKMKKIKYIFVNEYRFTHANAGKFCIEQLEKLGGKNLREFKVTPGVYDNPIFYIDSDGIIEYSNKTFPEYRDIIKYGEAILL